MRSLKYIGLRRNFGQTAAMDAGIKAARYDYIITMDGDRQNDPLFREGWVAAGKCFWSFFRDSFVIKEFDIYIMKPGSGK